MKKVRMTVQKDSVGKKFQIFNSPESLYVWLNDKDLQEIDELDPTLGTTIFLQSGETMEVEWMGCEFIVENKEYIRVDEIRLAKTIKEKSLLKSQVIGIHNGWTIESIVSFKSGEDEKIKRKKLTKKSKHKFNIEELFQTKKSFIKTKNANLDPHDIQ